MPFVVWLALVSELLLYPLAPTAALLAIGYLFSRSRAVTLAFFVALCMVALCNLSMLAAGSWQLEMINPFQSEQVDPYKRMFLPATLVALLAPLVKASIPLLRVPEPSDRSRPRPD
jgi:hypothetical protein